jgi:FkbH-like protein
MAIEQTALASSGKPELSAECHDGINFRVPRDLETSATRIQRVLLVGQCLLDEWALELAELAPDTIVERVLFNQATQLPEQPPHPVGDYEFQIVALPLRIIIHETNYLRLSYLDTEQATEIFEAAAQRLSMILKSAMRWNVDHGLLSFVANFFVPQCNPDGRLMPRYDLRNMIHFIERLNEHLVQEIQTYKNCFLLDVDQVSASIGRRYVQDDSVCTIAHGSILANFSFTKDQERIVPPPLPIKKLYNAKITQFVEEIWRETVGMYRTVCKVDAVKMVIMDLDDTLWRGVLAELETVSVEAIEGWPLGVIEALAFLRRRGVILAIVSKNEEANVTRIFDQILKHRLPLEHFALRRINWLPKAQNIQEVIQQANLLPKNVVFVDDNPVERASIAGVFPDLRIIGADPYALKRILLWSPETQVAYVTDESARRGEMIQAQENRETARKSLSREGFLESLDAEVQLVGVKNIEEKHFARAFELLNKTNQFNTTGKRWSLEEIKRAFDAGLRLICFFVKDRFTEYGLVGVILVRDSRLMQFVMSCRVLGLDVEKAVLFEAIRTLRATGAGDIEADFKETEANFPCRQLYASNGFERGYRPAGVSFTYSIEVGYRAVPEKPRTYGNTGTNRHLGNRRSQSSEDR